MHVNFKYQTITEYSVKKKYPKIILKFKTENTNFYEMKIKYIIEPL